MSNRSGQVQTPNFLWAELNANELKQKTSLIYLHWVRLMKSSASELGLKFKFKFIVNMDSNEANYGKFY